MLTQLTEHNAVAVGITTALQMLPQLLLLPLTGLAADRLDPRKLIMATQSTMGVLGLAMGSLTLSGHVQLWHMYGFALLLGCASAFDAPARQSFVSELVNPGDVANAVSLNSTAVNFARMGAPALAGVLTATVGSAWVFLATGVAFIAVLRCLRLVRPEHLEARSRLAHDTRGIVGGFRYVRTRVDLMVIMIMAMILGLFGPNFALFTSTMAVWYGYGAEVFGALNTAIAIGAITVAVASARAERPERNMLIYSSAAFGVSLLLGAVAPNVWVFGVTLVLLGAGLQLFMNTAHAFIQITVAPAVRGRVLALFIAGSMTLSPIGAPILGWVANTWGPPAALVTTGVSVLLASLFAVGYLVAFRGLRLRRPPGRRFGLVLRLERPTALPGLRDSD